MTDSDQVAKRPRTVQLRVGSWHQTWQNHFPEVNREVTFSEIRRRADVFVNPLVLEVQHSRILKAEIEKRTQDYRSQGKSVAWLLDGTTGVELVAQRGTGHLLHFSSEHQTIATFRWIGFVVLVDAGEDHVYLVPLEQLRGGCAWVPPPRTVAEVVAIVTDPNRHAELLWFEAPPPVCRLQCFQDPPGSGKTYNLIRHCVLALGPDGEGYRHYRYVFVLTKPHSAKIVVHKELVQQLKAAEASGEVQILEHSDDGKVFHYRLNRQGATDPVDIFFATVDSFIFHMAPQTKARQSTELFKNLAMTIESFGPKLDRNCIGKYRGNWIPFSAKSLICWDEATKLERFYMNALAKFMTTCAADAVLTGDVMQSIENSQNSLQLATNAKGGIHHLLPHCTIGVLRGDQVRRFGPGLVNVLNTVVNFTKWGAPMPRAADDIQRESEGECTIHDTPALSRSCHPNLYKETVDILWEQFEKDVEDLGLLPHELLIVTPLVKTNPVADEFRTRLDEFWTLRLDRPEVRAAALEKPSGREFYSIYESTGRPRWFAYFHRSEEGRPVDTTLSEWATRGVSIHSSQGDGRRLVYVIGLSEGALKCFTKDRVDTLEYESLWTVLMSRAKHRLRVFVERKYDDAWVRLKPFMSESTEMQVAPTFNIGTRPNLQRIDLGNDYGSENLDKFRVLQEDAVTTVEEAQRKQSPDERDGESTSGPIRIVEDSHHDIRMAIYQFAFLARMLHDEKTTSCKRQICAILNKASELDCRLCTSAREYYEVLRGIRNKEGYQELLFIPVHKNSRMPQASTDFMNYVARAKEAMKFLLKNQEHRVDLDDKGFIVFYHLIDITTNFQHAHTKFDMIYDVLDRSRSRHDENLQSHYADILKVARISADSVVSDDKLIGEGREWKLNHGLQLRTADGRQYISPHLNVLFLGFSDKAAAVVLLTPRLDATNITKVAGYALITALLLENPANKDEHRVQSCSQHWLCVAPLEGSPPVWIDVRELLQRNRDVVVEWLIGFLSDSCKQSHPGIMEFYKWHLKNGELPNIILELAEEHMKHHNNFPGSYVQDALKLMEDLSAKDEACGEDAFTTSLCDKMTKQVAKVRKWLNNKGSNKEAGMISTTSQGSGQRMHGHLNRGLETATMATIPAHGNSDRLHEDESAAVAAEEADLVAVMMATADPLPIGPGEWQNAPSATVS